MTENNEFESEELPEEDAAEPAGEEKFVGKKAKFEETLSETAEKLPHLEARLAEMSQEPPAAEEELEAVKEPTKVQLFVRRALIWLGVALAFFIAGFAVSYFQLYQPKVAEMELLQEQITDLEAEIHSLETVNAQLEADTADLEEAQKHTALLRVMVDAYDARYALGEENIVAAKSALSGTEKTLNLVLADIRSFDKGLADTLPQRLELIRTNLDYDTETAIEDCNQLIEDLLAVEAALFP